MHFTTDLREAEAFQSAAGSDCGIANVNIGTSGAEIGGHLAARRKLVAVASPAPIRGAPTCAGRPTPSTTRELPLAQASFSTDLKRALTTDIAGVFDGAVC